MLGKIASRLQPRAMVEARLRRMVERWPEVSGYRLNPDATVVDGIVKGLVRSVISYGLPYCPCRDLSGDPAIDRNNICPCKWHHEEIARDKHCRCQLFVGEGYDPAVAYRAQEIAAALAPSKVVRQRQVTVYLTSWCYLSRRARAFLDGKGIAYDVVDIEQNEEAALQVEGWTGGYRSTPSLVLRQIVVEPTLRDMYRLLIDSRATLVEATVYQTAHCPACHTVLGWLDEQALPYRAISLEDNPEARQQVMAWNGGYASVPTLDLVVRIVEPTAAQLSAALGLLQG